MTSVPTFPVRKISAKHAPTVLPEIFILGKIGTELIALLALLLQYVLLAMQKRLCPHNYSGLCHFLYI